VQVETGSLPALAAGLESLLAHPQALPAMQKRARVVAVEEHSIAREVEALQRLYAKLRDQHV
jgi:hypothetical protein